MSPTIVIVILWCAPHDDIAGPTSRTSPTLPLRRTAEITREVEELLRCDARGQSEAAQAIAAYRMTEVYRELKRDPRWIVSDSMQQAKLRLWNRLTRIKKEVQAKLRREGRETEALTDEEVLALADQEIVIQSLTDHLGFTGSTLGGAGAVLSQSGQVPGAHGGGAGPPDYGPDLVDLIQRTLVPDFWDVNGGPGSVVYYRPLRCLVVRATSDVHHRLGGTVGALRAVK